MAIGDRKSDELYVAVAALGEVSSDVVVPSGETWEVQRFEGNGAYLDDAHVCLVWDYGGVGEAIVRATHGDASQDLDYQCVGDGTKKLSIVLVNDTSAERALGASWQGRVVD